MGIVLARLTDFLRIRIRPQLLGGIGRALSSRNYRLYACGHIAHVHGWWGNRLGVGWLTWELTGSAAWLGIVAFAGMIPVMLIAPFAGAWADRYGHRRAALIAGSTGAMVTMTLGVAALSGHMTVPLLLVLSVLQGLLVGIEFPARQALIPQLVGRENIAAAVAFNATTFQVGAFLGPVLAGILISRWGAGASILLFALTNVWMAIMMFMIRHRHSYSPRSGQAGGMLSDIRDGFRYIAGHRSLRLLLLLSLTSGLLVRPYNELLPGFAADVFGRGAEGLAALNAAAGLGALTSALFLVFRGRNQGLVKIMILGSALAAVGLALFTATTYFPLAVVVLALMAMMMLAGLVGSYSLIQNMADPAMRGRVISINAAIAIGPPALGALILGWLAELVGLRLTLATTAVLAFIAVISIAPALRRRTAEMEADPPA